MPRVKRGKTAHKKHKKILKLAKGYRGRRSKTYRTAKQAIMKAGQYAYKDRKQKKRLFRKLWIININAACRKNGYKYSDFINKLKKKSIILNRKILANLAINDSKSFYNILKEI